MSKWKFYIETFGCKVNQHESQMIREAWENLGGQETEFAQEAQYICINSCAITAKAESDARNALSRLKRINPASRIILTGCAAQLFPDAGFKQNAGGSVSTIIQKNKMCLLSGPDANLGEQKEQYKPRLKHYKRARPVIKIQDGCRQNCAFCIVPQTRGLPVSRQYKGILSECHSLIDAAHVELILSGINLREYIEPEENLNFWQMLARLDSDLYGKYGKKIRLRLSSLEPTMLTNEALNVLAKCNIVVPHLHISLQHGSERILQKMGRGDTKPDEIVEFLRELGKIWPVMAIGADILVGFPGENDIDMLKLIKILQKLPLTYAHVFPYSPRSGTRASKCENQIPEADKTGRAALVRQMMTEKNHHFRLQQLKLISFSVVLDLPCKNGILLRGINEFYTPCILKSDNYSKGLITVKPFSLVKNGLIVEAI